MADKVTETKTEVPVEEPEKDKKEVVVEEKKTENGNKVEENGDAEEKKPENGEEEKCEKKEEVCCVKRKSAGGDAPDGTPAEGVTPEKKAKLEEKSAETETKEDVEAAA